MTRKARWFFRRKTGYMSPYQFRTVLRVVTSYPHRHLAIDPIYMRVGKSYIKVWKGNK